MIELPFPAKILWPNGRGHWAAKAREFRKHKDWAWKAAMAANWHRGDYGDRICWSVTVYPKTAHKIDKDNAVSAMKAYQDGIAEAISVDDHCFEPARITFGEPVKGGKVVVVLQ